MQKLKFSEFLKDVFGIDFTMFLSGTELLFAYEVNKYLVDEGIEISLEGLDVLEPLLLGDYFAFVKLSGMKFDEPYASVGVTLKDSKEFFVNQLTDVELGRNDGVIYFTRHGSVVNTKYMTAFAYSPKCYLSLFARVCVDNYIKGTGDKLIIDNSMDPAGMFEYSELYILQNYGNKLASDEYLELMVCDGHNQIGWESFTVFNRQLGLMCKDYTVNEKKELLDKRYRVGDVVLLYEKEKKVESRTVSRLVSCKPGVIDKITDKEICLRVYPDVTTRATKEYEILKLESDLYTVSDADEYYEARSAYDYTSIGIEGYVRDEEYFIMPLLPYDSTVQYRKLDDGRYEAVELDTIDTVYTVFKDRGVKFDEARFKERYYRDKDMPVVVGD